MPNDNRNSTTPARLEIHEKEKMALEMRLAGNTYRVIAEQLGWSDPSAALKAVKRIMKEQVREPSEDLRRLEVARLDRMLTALWPSVMKGKWLAHDRALKIMERKAALLGLDAPQRRVVDVITRDAFSESLKKLEEQIQELEAARPALGAGEEDYTKGEDFDAEAEAEEIDSILEEADVVDDDDADGSAGVAAVI